MRVKFTTTLEEEAVEKLKIESIKRKIGANDLLEELIEGYFEPKADVIHTALTSGGRKEINELLRSLSDWSWHNAAGYAQERKDKAEREGVTKKEREDRYKEDFERCLELSYHKIHELREHLEKLLPGAPAEIRKGE